MEDDEESFSSRCFIGITELIESIKELEKKNKFYVKFQIAK